MDVDSPENLSDDFCGFLKEDGGLDLNFETDKETYADDYVYDSFPSNSELHVEPHNQEEYSLHSDMRKIDFAGSPSENFHLLTEADFSDDFCLNVPTSENNPDNLQFQLRDNYWQVEREGFCGNNYKSSFDIEEGTLDDKTETGVAAELKESSSLEDTNQKQEAGLMPFLFPSENSFAESFLELSNYELTRSETACVEVGDEISVLQKKTLCPSPSLHLGRGGSKCDDKYDSRNSPGDNKKLEVIQSSRCNIENVMLNSKSSGAITQMFKLSSVSPGADLSPASQRTFVTQEDQSNTENAVLNSKSSGTIVQMFLSSVSPGPDQSPASQTTFVTQEDQSKVLRSHRSSTERSDLDKLVASENNSLNPLKKDSASLHVSEKVPQHRDNYPVELYNTSNRNHESPQELHRHDRSRSPTRRRESSSKHRKNHYRSRSRSPYRRNHYIRLPRRRYSPRQKSPPSKSHCYNRSSRRQPWSPPHNRNTGLGKPGRNLFVAGFSFVTTERDLERKFSRFGRVRDIRIVRDKRSGDSRGFGFLTLERDTDADAAIRALDQTEWNGRIILVEKSKSY